MKDDITWRVTAQEDGLREHKEPSFGFVLFLIRRILMQDLMVFCPNRTTENVKKGLQNRKSHDIIPQCPAKGAGSLYWDVAKR